MIKALDHLEPRGSKLRRWLAAAAMVAVLHVGGAAAALWQWPEEDRDDDVAGAMMVELAPVAIAPLEERQDIALGAPAEESAPTPPVEEVKELQPLDDIPPLPEPPLAQAPEVVLPKAEPVKEIEEKEEEKERQEATAASQAAAPPPIDAQEGLKPTAPEPGSSRKPSPRELSWQKVLHLHLSKHKRYPGEARASRIQGVVKVAFTIDRQGNVTRSRIIEGSGSPLLDDAALEMLKRASPLPAPPDNPSSTAALDLSLPIQFSIK
jgi:protein TonB